MEPYQKASEALRSGEEYPLRMLKNAGLTAIGGGAVTAGSKVLGKLLPAVGALINQYVPENISVAGLNKIDPRFGKFIQGAISEGYSYDDLRQFIGDKINKSQPEQAKESRNIIEQESPELHQFIDQEIRNGRTPIQAGAIAQNDKRFSKVINKLTQAHKTPWSGIVESVFGSVESPLPKQNQSAQMQGQAGPGQQRLMEILQRLMQARETE